MIGAFGKIYAKEGVPDPGTGATTKSFGQCKNKESRNVYLLIDQRFEVFNGFEMRSRPKDVRKYHTDRLGNSKSQTNFPTYLIGETYQDFLDD